MIDAIARSGMVAVWCMLTSLAVPDFVRLGFEAAAAHGQLSAIDNLRLLAWVLTTAIAWFIVVEVPRLAARKSSEAGPQG